METTIITTMTREEIIKRGRALAYGPLTSQAEVAAGLIAQDRPLLEEVLGTAFFPVFFEALERAKQLGNDKSVAKDESKGKTVTQRRATRVAVHWRRQATRTGKLLKRRGVAAASDLARVTSTDRALPNLAKEVDEKTALLDSLADLAPNPEWVRQLSAAGKGVSTTLRQADVAQELDIQKLPEKTQELHFYKGVIILALKQMNDAGKLVHPANPARAAAYNLDILSRNRGRRTKASEGEPPVAA